MRVCSTFPFAIVLAFSAAGTMAPVAAAQPLPKVSFARADWTSANSFSELSTIRELSNGNVIVADQQELQVHLLSALGKTLAPIGRKGSGPAEYQHPSRLIALANDTTLLVDRDARRFTLIDGRGKFIGTHPFPTLLADGAEKMVASDGGGRLYFRLSMKDKATGTASDAGIGRWQRGSQRFDTVAVLALEQKKVQKIKLDELKDAKLTAQIRLRFGPVDDWAVSPSGRIAMVRATPYRVDWLEKSGTTSRGAAVSYTPVAVTDQDKKRYEPKGPPFIGTYAKVKSPFMGESALADDADNVWVMRNEAAGASTRRWDVFNATGKYLGAVPISSDRRLLAVTKRYAYVARTDGDGLRWLERYSR